MGTSMGSIRASLAEDVHRVPVLRQRLHRAGASALYEVWYSPRVKQWVKIREDLDSGLRTRELISFDLL